jgi:hypothetical protein
LVLEKTNKVQAFNKFFWGAKFFKIPGKPKYYQKNYGQDG